MREKDFVVRSKVQILLHEYDSHREELFRNVQSHRQVIVIVLSSVSIALPLLLKQSEQINPVLLGGFLYFLVIMYSVVSMYTATLQYNIDVSAYYIDKYIRPKLVSLLSEDSNTVDDDILYWETYITQARAKPHVLYVNVSGTVGVLILLILPSIISLLMANYLTSSSFSFLQAREVAFLIGLKKFAWIAYILSIIGWVFVVFIELFEFQMVKKGKERANEENKKDCIPDAK